MGGKNFIDLFIIKVKETIKKIGFILNERFSFHNLTGIFIRFGLLQSIPNEIMVEVTDRCNLNCKFCFNKLVDKENKKHQLDTKSIKQIIDKVKVSGVKIIRFTGGEPLLREDIFELMDYAYNKGLRVWLNTNGTLINKDSAGKIAKYADNVLISLNAFDSKYEKKITGCDSFKKKIKGILLLKKNRIRYLRCGTVATKNNILNLEKIYNIVKRLDISNWELFRFMPLFKDDVPITNNDISLLVEKLLEINKKAQKIYKIANAIPFCSYKPEKVKKVSLGAIADDGHNRFAIDAYGHAKPMYYLLENIGDILQSDILQIWNCRFLKNMRRLKYVPRECKGCKYIKICKGGSRLVSKVVRGNYRFPDYLAQPWKYRQTSNFM